LRRLRSLLLIVPAGLVMEAQLQERVLAQQPNSVNVACFRDNNIPSPCPNPQNPNENNTNRNQTAGRSLWQRHDASTPGYW